MRSAGDGLAAVRGVVRKCRPHFILACAVAGLAAVPHGAAAVVGAAAIAALAGGIALGGRTVFLAAAVVSVAALAGSARIAAIDRPARAAPPGSVIDADATVLDAPRRTRFGFAVTMRIDTGRARGLRVYARLDRDARDAQTIEAGNRAHVRALVRDAATPGESAPASGASAPGASAGGASASGASAPVRSPRAAPGEANAGAPGTPGYGPLPAQRSADDFDFAAFLRSRAIGREVEIESVRILGRRAGIAGLVDSIRRRAERAIGAGLAPDRAALARGMVLGEDGEVADDVRDDFQRSGLAHLLAASGQNVMLLFALALPALVFARAGPRTRLGVLLALVALYVPLAGGGASVVRAGIMAAAALLALAAGRPASGSYGLLLAAAITLGLNPRATGDPGWRLSFAAVAGMLVLGPPLRRPFAGLPRHVGEAVAATLAATVATAPVLAHDFGAVSLAALPANLAALPAVAPVMWVGMTEAALAQAGILGAPLSTLATAACTLAAKASGLALAWIAGVARRCAEPGWSQARVHLSGTTVVAAYVALAVALLIGPTTMRRIRDTVTRSRALDALDAWRALAPRSRHATVVVVASLAIVTAAAVALPPGAPRRLTVDYLDVGQGDATLVRDPYGTAVLFDGGPPEARVDRLLRRLGVRRLSAVVATHQSRDHHGGLLQVIKRFPVDLFLDGGDGTRDPTFLALEREVDRRGIRRIPTRRGELLRIGAMTIRILWPGPRSPAVAPGDPNLRATVAIVSEAGFRLFLSADAESQVLLPLRLPHVDAMKVPHHGSADPGLSQLLARLRPRVAAIEVGRGNDYGHPRPPTLDALRKRVPYVYRTDRDGTVELAVKGKELAVRTQR